MELNELAKTQNFCTIPFFFLYTGTLAKPKLCPMGLKMNALPMNGVKRSLNRDNLMTHWNSDEMRTIRKKMLCNESVPECRVCQDQESRGLVTMRQMYVEHHLEDVRERVEMARWNDGRVDLPPAHWDLHVGNTCNLACRICSPHNSSRMENELNRSPHPLTGELALMADKFRTEKATFGSGEEYFKDLILDHAEHVRELKVQGGEPTAVPAYWEMMESLVENGHAKNIRLMVFTNLMHLTDRHIEMMNAFRNGLIFCSIDAHGAEGEFLRHPSKFDTIEKNMARLNGLHSEWRISMKSAISHYNCLSYMRLLRWANDFFRANVPRAELTAHDVAVPEHLRPDLVPRAMRLEAREKLAEFRRTFWLYNESPSLRANRAGLDEYDKILSMPEIPAGPLRARLSKTARESIDGFDKLRNQKTGELFPHLDLIFPRDLERAPEL
jgi:hypothetical protein